MTPTKYELALAKQPDGTEYFQLRLYAPEITHKSGFSVIEGCRKITGFSLVGLRKHGAANAKRFGVPFNDLTA